MWPPLKVLVWGLVLIKSAMTQSLQCPPDLEAMITAVFDENCYFYRGYSIKVSRPEAQRDCQNEAGTLIEIKSREINDFIAEVFYDYVHLFWIGAKEKDGETVWSNGEPVVYTNWFKGVAGHTLDSFFALFTREDLCVRTDSGFSQTLPWIRTSCHEIAQYLCQRPAVLLQQEEQKSRPKPSRPKNILQKGQFTIVTTIPGIDHPELLAPAISQIEVYSASVCARLCQKDEGCEMFNYNFDSGSCKLFNSRDVQFSSAVNSPGWNLWVKSEN